MLAGSWRPASMAKPYSMDLRERVVAAVAVDGMSCHAAAARFGVAASSAIKWVRRVRETGSAAPGQMGGHRLGILSGATRTWLLERTSSDFTLRGLVPELAERGVKVDRREERRRGKEGVRNSREQVAPL